MWEKADGRKIHRTGCGSLTREVCSQAHALEAGAVRQYVSKVSQKRKPTTCKQRNNYQQNLLILLHGNLQNWRICLLFICSAKVTANKGWWRAEADPSVCDVALSKSHLFTALTRQTDDETTETALIDQTNDSGSPELCFQRWPVRNVQEQMQDNTRGSASTLHSLPAIRNLALQRESWRGKRGGGREGEEITLTGQTELEIIERHTEIDCSQQKVGKTMKV